MSSEGSRRVKLSETLSLLPPQAEVTKTAIDSPKIIVITAWLGASQRAIDKYTSGYHELFPTAGIYVVQTVWSKFLLQSYEDTRSSFAPLIQALRDVDLQDVLVATYSNGGALKTSLLAEAYLAATGRPLSPRAMFMDSCPDKERISSPVAAAKVSFPRFWPIYYSLLVGSYTSMALKRAWHNVAGTEDMLSRSARILNDGHIVGSDTRRCYVYTETDEIVSYKFLLEHASQAQNNGAQVRTEKFVGSSHVGHMRVDGVRYWKLVSNLWTNTNA